MQLITVTVQTVGNCCMLRH